MRHVIYANDMEPLTVIELSELAESYLWRCGYVVLHLPVLNVTTLPQTQPVQLDQGLKSVRLRAEVFHRRSSRHLIICTEDEESALLLKCVFYRASTRVCMNWSVKLLQKALLMLGKDLVSHF